MEKCKTSNRVDYKEKKMVLRVWRVDGIKSFPERAGWLALEYEHQELYEALDYQHLTAPSMTYHASFTVSYQYNGPC